VLTLFVVPTAYLMIARQRGQEPEEANTHEAPPTLTHSGPSA
jgi:hypothetical protein